MKLILLLAMLEVALAIVVDETAAEVIPEDRLDALWVNHKVISLIRLKISLNYVTVYILNAIATLFTLID